MMTQTKNRKSGVDENTGTETTLDGLRSPGLLAKFPVLGIAMFLVGGLIFGILAWQLQANDALTQWDTAVAKTFRAAQVNAPWSVMENILFGLFMGKEVVALTGAILVLYFFHKRFWRELAMTGVGLGGGGSLWVLLSRYFDRTGPADHLDLLPTSAVSFPSGPALMAVLCYGLLAYVLVPGLPSRFWKWFAALLCALAVMIVGLSSLLFGAHHATDVIAGYALGLAWAGLAYTLAERMVPEETTRQRERLQTATMRGLRAPGWFQQHPRLAGALILLSGLSFAVLGYNILVEGSLVQLDLSLYKQLLAAAKAAPPLVNDLMLFGFFVGKQAVQGIVLILSLYFLSQRYWLEFAMLQISTQGGGVLKNLIIDYFARPRPPEQLGMVIPTLPSFPSGHALGTMICYGFLAYLLIPKMPSPFWKWMVGIGILSLVLFEGFSRIFHANHYLTDVLAAFALGLAWLVLVCTLMESVFMRRQA